jgi:hypothetical protein
LRHRHRGVSNPPGSGRDSSPVQTGGVAHAPTPSVTPAGCVRCAAQNAALVGLTLTLLIVGVERLATAAFADRSSSSTRFDWQLSVPELRQPPLFVAAPLAASAVPSRSLKTRVRRRSGNRDVPPPKCHQDLPVLWCRPYGGRRRN